MKIVVIGGTGLIGKKVVELLRGGGHEVVAASPSSGVNAVTGEGLDAALAGTEVVVDVANAPSFADEPVREFFEKSGHNLQRAELAAGVKHHVALSIVNTDRIEGGYMRAKTLQERILQEGKVPYTIVRATQFFEFLETIAGASTEGEIVRLPAANLQPIAASDVSSFLAGIALEAPRNGIVDLGGPDTYRFVDVVGRWLAARNDPRRAVEDPAALYVGMPVTMDSLVAAPGTHRGKIDLAAWLASR